MRPPDRCSAPKTAQELVDKAGTPENLAPEDVLDPELKAIETPKAEPLPRSVATPRATEGMDMTGKAVSLDVQAVFEKLSDQTHKEAEQEQTQSNMADKHREMTQNRDKGR